MRQITWISIFLSALTFSFSIPRAMAQRGGGEGRGFKGPQSSRGFKMPQIQSGGSAIPKKFGRTEHVFPQYQRPTTGGVAFHHDSLGNRVTPDHLNRVE